jgi:stearoyl-CoA desaturase (delta-9 desaturase)
VGWLFDHTQRGSRERFAPDLLADPVVSFVDKTFVLWVLLGLGSAGPRHDG